MSENASPDPTQAAEPLEVAPDPAQAAEPLEVAPALPLEEHDSEDSDLPDDVEPDFDADEPDETEETS